VPQESLQSKGSFKPLTNNQMISVKEPSQRVVVPSALREKAEWFQICGSIDEI
jgi:hypothetical protein